MATSMPVGRGIVPHMERSLYGTARGLTQPLTAGLVTALVGFSASFALVDVGLRAVGADQREAVSGLFAACLAVGGLAIWYGVRRRQPISIAWSTPGAALLVTAGRQHGGYPAAVGAFAVAGALIVLTGLSSRLVGWIGRIPGPNTSARRSDYRRSPSARSSSGYCFPALPAVGRRLPRWPSRWWRSPSSTRVGSPAPEALSCRSSPSPFRP